MAYSISRDSELKLPTFKLGMSVVNWSNDQLSLKASAKPVNQTKTVRLLLKFNSYYLPLKFTGKNIDCNNLGGNGQVCWSVSRCLLSVYIQQSGNQVSWKHVSS